MKIQHIVCSFCITLLLLASSPGAAQFIVFPGLNDLLHLLRCCRCPISGVLLWTQQSPNHEGIPIAADQQGNVYVAGRSFTSWLVAAYDPQGNLLWMNTAVTSGTPFATPNALVVDNAGGLYVAGQTNGKPRMVKFDARTGNIVWDVALSSLMTGWFVDAALGNGMVGSSFLVYATGASGTQGALDILTVGFDTCTGAVVAQHQYNGPFNGNDSASALAVAPNGEVWVTGTVQEAVFPGTPHLVVLRYPPSLLPSPTDYIHPASAPYFSQGYDIAVDQRGWVYVTGTEFSPSSGHDYLTIGFASFPSGPSWLKKFDGTFGNDIAFIIAVDSVGAGPAGRDRVVVAGDKTASPTGGSQLVTVAYDATTGAQVWVHTYPQRSAVRAPGNFFPPRGLAIDQAGNVYVGGVSYLQGGPYSQLVYNLCGKTGAMLWAWTGQGYGVGTSVSAITLDGIGNVLATGSIRPSGTLVTATQKFRQHP